MAKILPRHWVSMPASKADLNNAWLWRTTLTQRRLGLEREAEPHRRDGRATAPSRPTTDLLQCPRVSTDNKHQQPEPEPRLRKL
jgi:hypothetical protein